MHTCVTTTRRLDGGVDQVVDIEPAPNIAAYAASASNQDTHITSTATMPSKPSVLTLTSGSRASTSPDPRSPSDLSSPLTSPASTTSPTSPENNGAQNTIRSPTRSITFDTIFNRSRSKSPAPEAGLHHTKTAPAGPQKPRHKSEGSVPTLQQLPRDATFFQKRQKEKGSLDHYGRHGNDWLFGGISFRETAKGMIRRES